MKTYGYGRVSTINQRDNTSLENQKKGIEQYCQAYGIELDGIFNEQISGAKKERPELDKLMELVRNNEVERVIVFKLDRLGRNMSHLISLTDEFESLGVQFISISESIDTSTASRRLFKNILASISEFEREMIRDRVYSGKIAKAESGLWPGGKPPIGFKLVDGKIEIDEEQANIVRSIFQMYTHKKKQLSMTKIMNHLNEHEITTPSGSKWTSRGILNILKNPAYRGKAVWGGFEIDVPSLVPVRQYNKAQQLREQKRTTGNISQES